MVYVVILTMFLITLYVKNKERPTIYDKSTNGSRLLAEEVINILMNRIARYYLELKEFKRNYRNLAEDTPVNE